MSYSISNFPQKDTSGIYAIVNKVNGDKYVGSSANIEERWRRHIARLRKRNHHSVHLQRAWDKYGEASFEFVVLYFCPVDELIEIEQHFIDTTHPEYNISPTAGRTTGVVRSDEYRQKQRYSQSGKVMSEETRRKISEGMKGKKNSLGVHHSTSEEVKERIRAKLKGHPISEETKKKIGAKNRHYRHTEEAKQRISESLKGNKRAAKKAGEK